MLRRILHPGFAALLLLLVPITCKAKRNHQLCTSSCGNIHNISYPFRLKDDPESCGESEYELACENNRTILYLYSGKYKVEEIKYENFTIRVVDDFSSLPLDSCTYRNFTLQSPIRYWLSHENSALNFIDCEAPINLEVWVSTCGQKIDDSSCSGIHDGLRYGTGLHWCKCLSSVCPRCVAIVAVRALLGSPCVLIFLIYKWRRRNLSMYHAIEEFIQAQNNLTPIRYSYSNIKKMTKGFKEKLGEGGYGSVYKGKLRSGHLVAVKMMASSKANGQDFINEVATIGRIHHVNVVQLIGFCVEGSKRVLLYDFMPNGSLDKYIFPEKEGNISLSLEKMYEISLGVAHGIEYLHRGCDTQILHFDIKPHNILLDKNFTPKVSDFGLAKSYPIDHSIVSLTAARGTMGYMAPELFYKNIGGVSYKADVYSFGMLLMEMAGRRKNLNVFAEHSSQIYFPSWVYDQFSKGKDIEMEDATEEGKKLSKKLIIVALWCIQLKPSDRPSMNKVVEMLEGNVELLQMPPNPFLTPQEVPAEDHANNKNLTEMSIIIR
uniref:Protein kinase domain-containing protein n=2 Tax=Vitis vinifera TaxID=29760 RepID=F6HAL3_VITVI